jgi:wyosine [tRNA(Phe)-imidazoG37] synthetase (radical SAM superfamily)
MIRPREFHPPREVFGAAARRAAEILARAEALDFLTVVPDGEPTLDTRLGETLRQLRTLGIRTAVLSNGSLLWQPEVRDCLGEADWVSVKVDAVCEKGWRRLNRPHPSLCIETVLRGMRDFAASFTGQLTTETMLVAGSNDYEESIAECARFLAELRPSTAYVAVPTRPTVEPWAAPAGADAVNLAYQLFSQGLPRVELLTGWEGTVFGTTGDVEADLMGITSVHPMSRDAVQTLLASDGADWTVVESLIERGAMAEVEYQGRKFYVRHFSQAEGRHC